MFDFDKIEPTHLFIRQIKLVGLWDFNDKPWNKYYHLYGYVLHTVFTLTFLLAMYINITQVQNLDELSSALYMSLTETALSIKVLNIMWNSRLAAQTLKLYQDFSEGSTRNAAERRIINEVHAGFRSLRNLLIISAATVFAMGFIAALFTENFDLPFPCWFPFNYRNRENYYYAYFYQLVAMSLSASTNVSIGLYQAYILVHLSIYYKLLGNRLAKLEHSTDTDVELKRNFLFHTFIAGVANTCQRLISVPVFMQLLISVFVICNAAYKLQQLNFLEEPLLFVKYLSYVFTMSLEIYIPCSYGDEITQSATNLMNAIYSSNWMDLPVKTQKEIFIFMEALKKPIVLRAGNFFNIGLDVFVLTMNNAYKLYALMMNVDT